MLAFIAVVVVTAVLLALAYAVRQSRAVAREQEERHPPHAPPRSDDAPRGDRVSRAVPARGRAVCAGRLP